MKRYTLVLTIVSLFLNTHITSMDRDNSTEGIRAFRHFLVSNLAIEKNHILYYRPENIPTFVTAIFINWKTRMRDIANNYRISPQKAQALFISLVKETIIQNLSYHFPNQTAQDIQQFYNISYSQDLARLAYNLFKN